MYLLQSDIKMVNKNNPGKIKIIVRSGDITQIPADALITAINSAGAWFGGIDGAIQRVAGNLYHEQAGSAMPLSDLQVVIGYGNRARHRGQFDNVIFVVDDLRSSLDNVLYAGLKASHDKGYSSVLVPTIRMGVMNGVRESPEEAIRKMSEGLKRYIGDYPNSNQNITFVVYNNLTLQERLSNELISHL